MIAGIPRGCALNEPVKSPWKTIEIDFPNPQPGQFSIPTKLNRQKSKCFGAYGLIKAR